MSVKQRSTLERRRSSFADAFKSEIVFRNRLIPRLALTRPCCNSQGKKKNTRNLSIARQRFLSGYPRLGPHARYLKKLRRSFRDHVVSLALYMRANVPDAPYLSSLIILKAADAAANQRNARPRTIIAHSSVQDFHWRACGPSSSLQADDRSVGIKCPPPSLPIWIVVPLAFEKTFPIFSGWPPPRSWRRSVPDTEKRNAPSLSFSPP